MKKLVYLVLVLGLIVIAGCQQQATVKPTYQTANQVQTALNQNKQLKGKTVQVKVKSVSTNGNYGYVIKANDDDQQLRFVSKNRPKVKTGQTITLKITSVEGILGTYIIHYRNLQLNHDHP